MTKQTIYLPISADTPPEDNRGIFVICKDKRDNGTVIDTTWHFSKNGYQIDEHGESHFKVTHWLHETTAILLTHEQAEAYEKCVKELNDIGTWVELSDECKQALQQLNKIKP